MRCKAAFLFSGSMKVIRRFGGNELKKMLEVNDLNKMKVTGSNEKNKSMENTMNTRETALLIVATQVEDFDDLLKVQAETGLDMAELETMYYSII